MICVLPPHPHRIAHIAPRAHILHIIESSYLHLRCAAKRDYGTGTLGRIPIIDRNPFFGFERPFTNTRNRFICIANTNSAQPFVCVITIPSYLCDIAAAATALMALTCINDPATTTYHWVLTICARHATRELAAMTTCANTDRTFALGVWRTSLTAAGATLFRGCNVMRFWHVSETGAFDLTNNMQAHSADDSFDYVILDAFAGDGVAAYLSDIIRLIPACINAAHLERTQQCRTLFALTIKRTWPHSSHGSRLRVMPKHVQRYNAHFVHQHWVEIITIILFMSKLIKSLSSAAHPVHGICHQLHLGYQYQSGSHDKSPKHTPVNIRVRI